ncbi:hypothetical protein DVH24_025045 [Malus domestica]|uniref:GTP diphosphokinase n=1 Tax=Malus domestica TaxID=3750 RepID=A0A498JQ16_MALDO|nr:hypothetical protein DVH24_025045 [Malus domestica]
MTCQSSTTTMLAHKFHRLHLRNSPQFRCVLDQIAPNLAVSASLSSVFTSANVIAAASGSSSLHGAVTSTITQVAVTAVAIASGACLSTKVDFLWPKMEAQPGSDVVEGVDVTGYPIFNDPKVQKAVAFAKKAHHGQLRKTGDPYLVHCIHTGRILAMLVPASGERAVETVVAGILHDVVDDTCVSFSDIQQEFGDDVAKLVAGVSRLSYINQANNLRVMLLGMVDDPRVVLIKLADRLHNMRTIYALPLPKAQAFARETLVIWCSLASRLGLWAMKAELEDLCFAVLQPEMFKKMRADLASMWSSSNKDLLEAVVPFDVLLDRRKRSKFLNTLGQGLETHRRPKVVQDAGIALASMVICEEALEQELIISTSLANVECSKPRYVFSYVPGMEVTLSSRLKSLYSIYSKMKRKDVSISKVYDARALRVVVGDNNGTLHGPAVQCCYSLLDIVHKHWTPIDGEFDDYIVNPKPSGYQRMHEYAEHGLAAHWLYKETGNTFSNISSTDESEIDVSSFLPKDIEIEDQSSTEDDFSQKYDLLKIGHPVLRVEGSHLLAAVIIRVEKDGRELIVAVSFGLAASEAVADRKSSFQIKRWEAYARLYKKVTDEWWCEPGHGDWCNCLERYTLCRDGMYHKRILLQQDQFGRLLPTFIQVIDLTDQEESEYWSVVSAVFDGRELDDVTSAASFSSVPSTSMETSINNKVRLLRTMLRWEEQLRSEASLGQAKHSSKFYRSPGSVVLGEVVIIWWPDGEIMRLRTGSTAADAARRVGLEGKLVLVNGQLVLPNTKLTDGDVVEVRA